jgi:hypothetical protein
MSHTISCDCPLCPLQRANVQVCDAVLIQQDNKLSFGLPLKHENYAEDSVVSTALSTLVHVCFDMYKDKIMQRKVNEPIDLNTDHYVLNFLRTHKRMWKVCFHIKTKEEDPC